MVDLSFFRQGHTVLAFRSATRQELSDLGRKFEGGERNGHSVEPGNQVRNGVEAVDDARLLVEDHGRPMIAFHVIDFLAKQRMSERLSIVGQCPLCDDGGLFFLTDHNGIDPAITREHTESTVPGFGIKQALRKFLKVGLRPYILYRLRRRRSDERLRHVLWDVGDPVGPT